MHRCEYYDRLEYDGEQFVRTVLAICPATRAHGHMELDVYRESEDGWIECRNLYYNALGGYLVEFPNEVNKTYRYTAVLEEWDECTKINMPSRMLTDAEREALCREYPRFGYVLAKWRGTIEETMSVLNVWKEHPEVEYVLASGFERVAMSARFWTLSGGKRKEVALFMRKNPRCRDMTLSDILSIVRHGYDVEDYLIYLHDRARLGRVSYPEYLYIQTQDGCGVGYYRDYMKLLRQTQHNARDDYWRYPKDLRAAHERVAREVEREKALRDAEKLKAKQGMYSKAVRKYMGYKTEIDGYSVYVPDDVLDVQRQAVELHQCLVSCDYIGKVIDKECVLVFVRKDDVPIATAEILPDWSIGQFYANELNRFDCLPTDEVRGVMGKWLEKFSRRTRRCA